MGPGPIYGPWAYTGPVPELWSMRKIRKIWKSEIVGHRKNKQDLEKYVKTTMKNALSRFWENAHTVFHLLMPWSHPYFLIEAPMGPTWALLTSQRKSKRGQWNQWVKKNGKIIGSTPFIFRIHGAPKDYSRFTKDHLIELLKSNNFENIQIIELGTGPFMSCISLMRSYLKYLPI